MLMRTQAGCLYESLSKDNGTTWSAAAHTFPHLDRVLPIYCAIAMDGSF
jgi:hypothetical protein